jgi:murein DD-endopeptidase MepM/ murein hydrolase activator NlpD
MRCALMGVALVLLGGCETNEAPKPAVSATATAAASPTPSVSAAPSSTAKPAPKRADPSRLKLEGKPIQGGLMLGRVDPKTRGFEFPGHRLVVSPEGEFLVAFYRNAPRKEVMTITFPDGAVLEHTFEVEQRTYEDDRIDNLPDKYVNLDRKTKAKLHLSQQRIKKLRMGYTKVPHYQKGFVWPLSGKITSRYGQKRILNGTDGGIHWGVDIAAPVGTPVKAPAPGKVLLAEAGVPLAGTTIIIDHGHGLTSTLIHLNSFAVKVGQDVAQGDVVGTVGMTGRTNGPHLDWRMNFFEIRIDPELLVPPMDR